METGLQPIEPPRPDDVTAPVKRHLVSTGILVVAAGLVFGAVGLFRSPSETSAPEVVAQPSDTTDAGGDTTTLEPTGQDDPVGDPSDAVDDPGTVDGTAVEPSEAVEPEPSAVEPEPEPEPSVVEPEPEPSAVEPEPEPEPEPSAAEPEPSDGRIDPSTISIQVLDAVLDDGGETAREVGSELRGDGYRVVATNQAIRTYEETTVMYTAGFEAQARQIAAEYGFKHVQPKPDNLSGSVQVHLVVGLDAR